MKSSNKNQKQKQASDMKVVSGKSSKIGQIKMISGPTKKSARNQRNPIAKAPKKGTVVNVNNNNKAILRNNKINDSTTEVNINFKEPVKDLSVEIPKPLLCNICKKLVKNPVRCYQCKALFCKECLLNILEKNHKCPKCFKVISENLIKSSLLTKEFENTFIKCKYLGCQDKVNLFDYEKHLETCPFRVIKSIEEVDNLIFFQSIPFEKDPYSNSELMNYSVNKAENDFKLNGETSLVNQNDEIENLYQKLQKGEGEGDIQMMFKNIMENSNQLDGDIELLDVKKDEINEQIKQLQNKIVLHEATA